MPDLIAQGPQSHQRWRRAVAEGKRVVLGRSPAAWSVPWDQHVSRQHAELLAKQGMYYELYRTGFQE